MRVIHFAAFIYVGLAIVAPYLRAQAPWLKPVGFWLGTILACTYVWLRIPGDVRSIWSGWVMAAPLVGLLSALIAFALADYSLRNGFNRLVRFFRYLPRRFDWKAFGLLSLLAVYEELIWRGAVQAAIGVEPAGIALAAAAFSLAHLPPTRKLRLPTHVELWAFAVTCGTVVVLANSLIPAIVIHVIRNWACHTVRYEHDLTYRHAASRVLTTDRSRDDARRTHLPAVSD